MKFRSIAMLSAATLSLAACGHKADTADSSANVTAVDAGNDMAAAAPALSPGQTFANAAAASDTFEIESSKLALTMSKSVAVKKFAQKMIDAHTTSTGQLKTAAASASPAITPDPTLTPDQRQKLDALKTQTGAAFDQSYIAAQTAGHQDTLDKLKSYSASGDVAPLKSFATTLVPIVTAHLNMAKGLKS